MALTLAQIQTNITNNGDARQILNQIADYLEANPGPTSLSLAAYAALGSVVKAEPLGTTLAQVTANLGLTNNSLRILAIPVEKAFTATGVKWFQNGSGDYTASEYNGVGLYSYNAGVLTLIASSANDGNIWKQTFATWGTKAFTSPVALVTGIYFIGILYNNSDVVAGPSVFGRVAGAGAVVSKMDFTNGAMIAGTLDAQATLPTPVNIVDFTATHGCPYIVLFE